MDYLEELSKKLGGKIRAQELYNWNFKEPSFRELIVKDYNGFKILIDEFGVLFEIKIEIECDYFLAINNPEKTSTLNQTVNIPDLIQIPNFPYKVYVHFEYNPFEDTDFKAFWDSFSINIEKINLTENELIFIDGYTVSLALDPNRNLISVIDDVISIINDNPSIFYKSKTEKFFKKNIPENLRPLIPLLKKWSIPDDSEREQLIEEASEKQKKKIVKTVLPYVVEINKFLDSFGDEALSHEAMLLENLAELVSELQII